MSTLIKTNWFGQTVSEYRYGLWLFDGKTFKEAAIETIKNLRYF
jgi:hypothetical protein